MWKYLLFQVKADFYFCLLNSPEKIVSRFLILNSATVFNMDNKKKCFLSTNQYIRVYFTILLFLIK